MELCYSYFLIGLLINSARAPWDLFFRFAYWRTISADNLSHTIGNIISDRKIRVNCLADCNGNKCLVLWQLNCNFKWKYFTCFKFSSAFRLASGITVPLPGCHTCLHLPWLGNVDVLDVAVLCECVLTLFILNWIQSAINWLLIVYTGFTSSRKFQVTKN